MRFKVTSTSFDDFFSDSAGEFEACTDIAEVVDIINDDWLKTPDYVSYLNDKQIDGETICIIDFNENTTVFISTAMQTIVDIKLYD